MTQAFIYRDPSGAWSVNLGTTTVRLGDIAGFAESAYRGENGVTTLTLDDISSSLGHAGDGIRGLQDFYVTESAEGTNNKRTYSGTIAERDYLRGDQTRPSLRTGVSRQIAMTLNDLNANLGFWRVYSTDGKRPAETVGDRLTWLLGSSYFEAFDNGFVDYPATNLTASDYQTLTAGDVLADCALAVSYNYFLYYDESAAQVSLWFKDSNASTDWSSSVYLTNILGYIDSGPAVAGPNLVFPATIILKRSPAGVGSRAIVPYASGYVAPSSGTVSAKYRRRDLVAPNANTKSSAAATSLGNAYIAQNDTEDDSLSIDYECPASHVNHVRAGQRVPVKADHLGGMDAPTYDDWTWVRVLRRGVSQNETTPDVYQIHLDCTPQENPDVDPPSPPSSYCGVVDNFSRIETTAWGTPTPRGLPAWVTVQQSGFTPGASQFVQTVDNFGTLGTSIDTNVNSGGNQVLSIDPEHSSQDIATSITITINSTSVNVNPWPAGEEMENSVTITVAGPGGSPTDYCQVTIEDGVNAPLPGTVGGRNAGVVIYVIESWGAHAYTNPAGSPFDYWLLLGRPLSGAVTFTIDRSATRNSTIVSSSVTGAITIPWVTSPDPPDDAVIDVQSTQHYDGLSPDRVLVGGFYFDNLTVCGSSG